MGGDDVLVQGDAEAGPVGQLGMAVICIVGPVWSMVVR